MPTGRSGSGCIDDGAPTALGRKLVQRSPSSRPSPRGEGETSAASSKCPTTGLVGCPFANQKSCCGMSSPWGEETGEGGCESNSSRPAQTANPGLEGWNSAGIHFVFPSGKFSARIAQRSWSFQRPQILTSRREKPSRTNPHFFASASEGRLVRWMLASMR
jgi:hypothetical protein